MAKLLVALLVGCSVSSGQTRPGEASAPANTGYEPPIAAPIAAPPEKKAPPAEKKPAPPSASCTLLTPEGPRGGRLEVEGQGFGKSPLVQIAGRVTRMIERTETRIAVQIHADSDGGAVSVKVGGVEVPCGTLTIIGKN